MHNWALALHYDRDEKKLSVLSLSNVLFCIETFNRKCAEQERTPVIFLSHNSKNKAYADPLRNFIVGLGVRNDQLIYTSHKDHKIPVGKNIYNYLAEKIHSNSLMLNLWSNAYFNSIACISETGAAWVSGCDYVGLCIPPLSFNDTRFKQTPIDSNRVGIMLNGDETCKKNMMELGEKIQAVLGIQHNPESVERLVKRFIRLIPKRQIQRDKSQ